MTVSLGQLAVEFGLELRGDPDVQVRRVATLSGAAGDAVSFLANQQYRSQLESTTAAAVILAPEDADACPVAALVSSNPYAAYARVADRLHPLAAPVPGNHGSAVIGDGCVVPDSSQVGPLAVLGDRVQLGEGVVIGPSCVVGNDAVIGDGTRLIARVTITDRVRIGRRCIFHPGVVIGADGFGIAPDDGAWVKVPQLGTVEIGDDVEIGANTTVDRGAIDNTVIGDGVKLDNHIQIGHNVHIGDHTVMAAKVGVSGSTRIGKRCMIAADCAFTGHLDIADDVVMTARAVLTHSVKEPGVFAGLLPADESRSWRKNVARFRQLDDLARRLKKLEKTVARRLKGGTSDE